ncbi:MAG TPA: YkgJ family cysteine cluster protein [Candidatus Eisenbacteria bacterium]
MDEPKDEHSAKPHAPGHVEAAGDTPLRPPRPAIGLRLMPDGRYELPPGNPCEGCDHCCRYMTVAIAPPRTRRDFDNIRWYVLHRGVSVYADWEGTWMVQFDTPCAWLKDGRCSHYALRPDICREYDPAECERYATTPAERFVLRNEKDLDRFLAEREARLTADRAKRADRRKNGTRSRRATA